MKQFLKMTALASAVAFTCGTATAGTVAVTKQVHSVEGLEGVTASQTSGNIVYTLGATYKEGDKLTLTFPSDTLNKTTPTNGFPTVVVMDPVHNAVEANSIAGLTWGLLNATIDADLGNGITGDQVTYRVTALTQPNNGATPPVDWDHGNTEGGQLGLSNPLNISYNPQALLNAPITVTISSETESGDVLDNLGTRTATIAEAKTQFGALTVGTKFNGVIDVVNARNQFVGGTTDSMSYTVANPSTTGWLNVATVNTAKASVYGKAGSMTGLAAANWAAGGTVTFTEDAAKVEVAYTTAVTNDTVTFSAPTGANAVTLEAQSFTTDFVYNYTSAGSVAGTKTVVTGADSGEWTLNGALVTIPYMPYGRNISQVINVTNSGGLDGDITATAFDKSGNQYDLGMVGTAKAKTITRVDGAIANALSAAITQLNTVNDVRNDFAVTLTVNAASEDISVFAQYNVNGADRTVVEATVK